MNDTIQQTTDAIANACATTGSQLNWWMIIAIAELVLIIALLIFRGKKKQVDKKSEIKRKVMNEGEIDFGNVINSAFASDELYKKLIRSCHPDRFPGDEDKIAIANDLSSRITKSQKDQKALKALKEEAEQKLNIHIN